MTRVAMRMSELRWVVAGAGLALSMGACTSIIGDGYVIEDEDDDDDGPPPPPGGNCTNAATGPCETCYDCFCQAEFFACVDSIGCTDCVNSGLLECPDPTYQQLLSCTFAYCSSCDTSGA